MPPCPDLLRQGDNSSAVFLLHSQDILVWRSDEIRRPRFESLPHPTWLGQRLWNYWRLRFLICKMETSYLLIKGCWKDQMWCCLGNRAGHRSEHSGLLEFGDLHPCLTSSHADLPILIHGYSLPAPPAPPLHSTQGAITNYHRLGGKVLKQQTFISHISGGWKFEIKTLTDPLSGKNPLPDSQIAVFSLYHHLAERVERGSKLMCFLIKAP